METGRGGFAVYILPALPELYGNQEAGRIPTASFTTSPYTPDPKRRYGQITPFPMVIRLSSSCPAAAGKKGARGREGERASIRAHRSPRRNTCSRYPSSAAPLECVRVCVCGTRQTGKHGWRRCRECKPGSGTGKVAPFTQRSSCAFSSHVLNYAHLGRKLAIWKLRCGRWRREKAGGQDRRRRGGGVGYLPDCRSICA